MIPVAAGIPITVENLSAVAVLAAGFLIGVRWILAHVSKLSDQQFKIMAELLKKNHALMGEVTEVLRQNSRLLESVQRVMERCAEHGNPRGPAPPTT